MGFAPEPNAFNQTAISDLQTALAVLRSAVVDEFGFVNADKLLFYIDEAMSLESVRNLKLMKATLLLVCNIASQDAPKKIIELTEMVRDSLDEVFSVIAEGEKLLVILLEDICACENKYIWMNDGKFQ